MIRWIVRRALPVAVAAVLCSGCSTLPSGKRWGEDATFAPGWRAVGDAASESIRDPWVWAPLAGAALFQIDHFDRRTSDWAREHTPVFGSQRTADDWSDRLVTASVIVDGVTMLATPGGDDPGDWLMSKTKGALVGIAAIGATALTTAGVKDAAQRERPNAQDDESMPSGHASSAAVHTRLTALNLDYVVMDDTARSIAKLGVGAISVGAGWARVESGWHYPSDVLVGMAIGNFFASFFNHAFLGANASDSLALSATDGGAMLHWQIAF